MQPDSSIYAIALGGEITAILGPARFAMPADAQLYISGQPIQGDRPGIILPSPRHGLWFFMACKCAMPAEATSILSVHADTEKKDITITLLQSVSEISATLQAILEPRQLNRLLGHCLTTTAKLMPAPTAEFSRWCSALATIGGKTESNPTLCVVSEQFFIALLPPNKKINHIYFLTANGIHLQNYELIPIFPVYTLLFGTTSQPEATQAIIITDTEAQILSVTPVSIADKWFAHRDNLPMTALFDLYKILENTSKTLPHTIAEALFTQLRIHMRWPSQQVTDASLPFGLHVDFIYQLGNDEYFLSGWIRDPLTQLKTLILTDDLGRKVNLLPHLHHFHRADVAQSYAGSTYGAGTKPHGFMAHIKLPSHKLSNLPGTQLYIEAMLKNNLSWNVVPNNRTYTAQEARSFLLQCINSADLSEEMLKDCLAPALSIAQQRCMEDFGDPMVIEYGPTCPSPAASLIIPLYRRLDFLKIQYATFCNDPELHVSELIYVLDSPEQADEVKQLLDDLTHIYPLPTRLVVMPRNGGYAAATNAGATQAKSDMLVLLNSDVFAAQSGWLGAMQKLLKRQKAGAVGARLLYEDNSLQHAGMHFAPGPHGYWINKHYFKGYPSSFPAVQESRAVPAVTGACLMVQKETFDSLGGLDTRFAIGDFEDSDFCLRLREKGLQSWYCADAILYHLERQSVVLHERGEHSLRWRYNAWQHHHKWQNTIRDLSSTEEKAA